MYPSLSCDTITNFIANRTEEDISDTVIIVMDIL